MSREPSPPSIPSCRDIPCAIPGADQPNHDGHTVPDEELRGRVLDERGEPVRARVAVHDTSFNGSSQEGVFVATAGTRADGSFVLGVPLWSADEHVRVVVVESLGGFRILSAADLPSGSSQDIVLPPVRPLPIAISLPEPPPVEGMFVSMVVDHGNEEGWARHTLVHPTGTLGSRSLTDSSGGLLSLSADGRVLRATVLVPVGEVRIGVHVHRSRPALEAGTAEASQYGTMINDLALEVPLSEGPLAERSLPVPHPQAVPLEIVYRPAPPEGTCARWSVHMRRVGGMGRFFDADYAGEDGWTLRLAAVAPGTYEIGADPGCLETVDVRAGRAHVITLRRSCAVSCLRGHPFCGVGFHIPPR